MNINQLRPDRKGRQKFDLNVGGFTIKGCKWHSGRGSISFPARYSLQGKRYGVIWASDEEVKKLRSLLESCKKRGPNEENVSPLTILPLRWIKQPPKWDGACWVEREWLIFSFALNGFEVRGCRWNPQSGDIRMPVTFHPKAHMYRRRYCRRVRQVVTADRAHKELLIEALEAQFLCPIANRVASHGQEEMQYPPPQMGPS
jgi:hypothetical protein